MRFLLLALFLSTSPSALADDSCYSEHLVVDRTDIWDLSGAPRADFYLPSQNTFGSFLTKAAAHIEWNGKFNLRFDYIVPKDQMGLAYNLYRVEILVDGHAYGHDLTADCQGPGYSFFPGASFALPSIKISLPESDELGPTPVRIRIWGHL